MVLIKLGLPDYKNIVSRNRFVINKIFPIAIRSTNIPDQFIILFVAYQDYDDSYNYFQIMLKTENGFDQTYLQEHELNISQFAHIDDPNIIRSPQEQDKLDAYHKLTSHITDKSIYATDFKMDIDINYPNYYHSISIRMIDKTHVSVLDIFFPVDNFVKLKIYLDRIVNLPFKHYMHEEIFRSVRYHNVEIVNIETVKLDATKRFKSGEIESFETHYTMNCGPSEFKMNWVFTCNTTDKLKVPLDSAMYDAFYKDHYFITETFLDDKFVYILYENKSSDGSLKKLSALRLNKKLYDKTNFVDPTNIFIKEGE